MAHTLLDERHVKQIYKTNDSWGGLLYANTDEHALTILEKMEMSRNMSLRKHWTWKECEVSACKPKHLQVLRLIILVSHGPRIGHTQCHTFFPAGALNGNYALDAPDLALRQTVQQNTR